MSKYEPLKHHLQNQTQNFVPMTFGQIERIIGAKLPASAYSHRAWWSNNPSNNVMTHFWLAAGFKTEDVNMTGRSLVFRR